MNRRTTNDDRIGCLFATCALGFLGAQSLAQVGEPDPYVSPESEDLDGDGAPDTIIAQSRHLHPSALKGDRDEYVQCQGP